jgi:hypothetical protein
MRSDLSEHYCCVQKGMKNHIRVIFIIYKLFLGISYVFLMSIVYKHLRNFRKLYERIGKLKYVLFICILSIIGIMFYFVFILQDIIYRTFHK